MKRCSRCGETRRTVSIWRSLIGTAIGCIQAVCCHDPLLDQGP